MATMCRLALPMALLMALFSAPDSWAQFNEQFTYIGPNETVIYDPIDGTGAGVLTASIIENPGALTYPTQVCGFSMAMGHPGDVLLITEVGLADALQQLNDGDGPEFFSPSVNCGGPGFKLGCIFSLLGLDSLMFENATPVIEISCETIPDDLIGNPGGAMVPLAYCDDCQGDPYLTNTIVDASGQAATLDFADGVIIVQALNVPFMRGDADASGDFNGLVDALFILDAQFGGGPLPTCMDAADSNDDGEFNGIIDAIWLLSFQYTGGPPPPAPGLQCGDDPTFDGLSCAEYEFCP